MKRLLLCLLLSVSTLSPDVFSQTNDTIGLKRFYWNVIPFVGLDNTVNSTLNSGANIATGGLQFKIGNNWLLKKRKRSATFLRLTWVRLGVQPFGLILTPLHLGAGLNYDLSETKSLELSLNGGLVITTDDILHPDIEFNYLVMPEIKINLRSFSIGAEYSFRTFRDNFGDPTNRWHYIGLTIGGRFGKTLK